MQLLFILFYFIFLMNPFKISLFISENNNNNNSRMDLSHDNVLCFFYLPVSYVRVATVSGERCVSSSSQPGQITGCQSIPRPSSTSSAGSKLVTHLMLDPS